jgi:PAS domain S-box-containing protein
MSQPQPPTHILLVEDEPAFAEMLGELLLVECGRQLQVSVASRLDDTLGHLRRREWDLVLLDLSLPDCQGLETFAAIKRAAPLLPVIVLTGLDDETVALQAVRDGAQDYLVKGRLEGHVLARAIRYAIERNQAERQLRQNEEFFRLISENVTDMVAVLDAEGNRLYNSPSYAAVLGDPGRLRGRNAFQDIHPDDRDNIRAVFREVVTTGEGRRAEYRFILPDGAIRHVESQSNVIRDESGRPAKVVVISRDVSARLQAERDLRTAHAELQQSHAALLAAQQRLVQSEKLEAVATFAAGVAHEVKNPLQTVTLGLDYFNDYLVTDDPNAGALIKQMRDAVRRADATIRALLDFSSYRKGAVTAQNLNDILRQALHPLQSEIAGQPIQIVEAFAAHLPMVRLDARAMRHVFISLFASELEKLVAGGTLSVRTTVGEATAPVASPFQPLHSASASPSLVQVRIESRRELPPAGDAPASAGGTDFGLLVLKKTIELYGGRVESSLAETGNRFEIAFTPCNGSQL